MNVAQKLIQSHLVSGTMTPGEEVGVRVDQTLTQDATGTMVMLELEAMGIDRAQTETSVQYVDHNLLQVDHRNPDDHVFLMTASKRLGIWFSRAGNGVSHPVHQERFGIPGKTLLGSDSHTPAAGAIGMLAIGAGGIEVALAIAGEPFFFQMPEIWGVQLTGHLPDWVSAKDIILELLRRHGVDGGVNRILEFYGPGLEDLSAMDRHVIANMGAELGATTTVFPSDNEARRFLKAQGREEDWIEVVADPGSMYDVKETLELSDVVPLVAKPSSPGNVVPVHEIAGAEIFQAYIGSSANPGYRDFAIAAEIVRDRQIDPRVSFDINPTSRQILATLIRDGHLHELVKAGARIHQAGCNGCIGMGQAPATDRISLRTVPRNFPGRSGVKEDRVFLVSPETAAASALNGTITDPRTLGMRYPKVREPEVPVVINQLFIAPESAGEAAAVDIVKGPNIGEFPAFDSLPESLVLPVLLTMGDNVSTDEILPAGTRVLPYRSNIPRISEFAFDGIDPTYPERARASGGDGHCIVAGANYGQGSSREHAVIAPRYLGLRAVIARSFARIHWQNLVNFGILPLEFDDPTDLESFEAGATVEINGIASSLTGDHTPKVRAAGRWVRVHHSLSKRQVRVLLAGGVVPWVRKQRAVQ